MLRFATFRVFWKMFMPIHRLKQLPKHIDCADPICEFCRELELPW